VKEEKQKQGEYMQNKIKLIEQQ